MTSSLPIEFIAHIFVALILEGARQPKNFHNYLKYEIINFVQDEQNSFGENLKSFLFTLAASSPGHMSPQKYEGFSYEVNSEVYQSNS